MTAVKMLICTQPPGLMHGAHGPGHVGEPEGGEGHDGRVGVSIREEDRGEDQGGGGTEDKEVVVFDGAAPVYDGSKVVAAVNESLQAQSVATKPDPESYLASVAQEIVATAKLISADLSARG